jgi:DNA-binding PadR family transcriptional regulator
MRPRDLCAEGPPEKTMVKPAQLIPGSLNLLILKAVSLGKKHGYGILLRIEEATRGALTIQQGALYPALHRLVERRLLKAKMGNVGEQPPRQVLSTD